MLSCVTTSVLPDVAGGNSLLDKVLSNQGDTIRQVLGRPVQASAQQPSHAVVIACSAETIGSAEASCSFEVMLTQPTFRLDTEALCQVDHLTTHDTHCFTALLVSSPPDPLSACTS